MKAAIALLLLAAAGLAADAAELELTGTGSSAKAVFTDKYDVKPLTPYRVAFEARKAGANTLGRTICAGFTGLNVDLDLAERWKAYSDIVSTPSKIKAGGLPVRFTLWQVNGNVLVRDWKVVEQQVAYARDGELVMGDGETLLGTEYQFNDRPDSYHHNHSRPLAGWNGAVLNTDRYPFGNGAEIVWRHELGGRQFLSATVSIGARYYQGGEVRVDVSKDGANWSLLDRITGTNRSVRAQLPADFFPADRIFARVTGEKCLGVQLATYGFRAAVTGEPRYLCGATRYADVGSPIEEPRFTEPEYYRTDYGELVPDTSSALALWRASSGWKIPRNRPVPTRRANALELAVAANEAEAVQLVLTPVETVSNVTVEVEVPPLSAQALRVAYLRVDDPVDHTVLSGEYPDPLPPQRGPMTIRSGVNQPFWIRVKAPKGARKGIYKGWVTVRGERTGGLPLFRKFERKVPIAVEVFGFELPDRMTCRTLFGFYPDLVNQYHGLSKRDDCQRVYADYMRQLSDYHLSASAGATYGLRSWIPKWKGDEPVFNWTEWDEGMARGFGEYHFTAMRISGGLGLGGGDAQHRREPEIAGVKEGDPRYEVRLERLLKGVQDHLEEKGWLDRTYIYCFDEPPEKDNAFVMKGFAKLAKYAPKLRRFLTSPCRRDLIGGPQTWCPIAPDLESDLARERQKAGDEFWLYVCCSPRAPYATEFIEHPGVELRTWLWQSWAENVKGVLVWTSNLWTSKSMYPDRKHPQNPYVDPQAWNPNASPWGNGDGRFVYPPESVFEDISARNSALRPGPNFDKPVGSVRGEMLRDGIEDYEYLAILKRLDPGNPLLKVPASISKSLSDFSKSPAGIEAHRLLLAREIERLSANR